MYSTFSNRVVQNESILPLSPNNHTLQTCVHSLCFCRLRIWNYSANVAKSSNGEGEDLQKQVDEVVVLPIQEVIASTHEQKHRESKLVHLNPVSEDLGQGSLRRPCLVPFVLERVSELLRHHPLVHSLGLQQADDGGLGAVEGHHVLEQHPVEEQVEGAGSSDGVEGGDDAGEVDGPPFGDVDFWDEDCEREHHAVEEECEHVGDDLSHEEEAVDYVELLEQRYFLPFTTIRNNSLFIQEF